MDYSYLRWQVIESLLAYIAPFLAFILVIYIVGSLALYKMAAKFYYPNLWLAWIPIANTYLLFVLPVKKFKVLLFNKELERTHAFWIYIGTCVGGFILSFIPLINILAVIAIIMEIVIFLYPMYHDLYELFVDESTATTYAILSLLIPGAALVFLLIVSGKKPRMEG